jgi:2-dehydropantoate 2-reductase
MRRNLAVLGTGSIGSCVGADLTKAGHNAVLIDQWPAHIEAMKINGLRIVMTSSGAELHTPVRALHLCEVCALRDQFDIVFLTAKSYDTHWMVEFIKPHLKLDGVLVSLQNSLNDEWIAPLIGYERDMGGVVELSAKMFEPGLVKRNTDHSRTWFALGELHGRMTPRVEEVAEILRAVGKTEVTTNIWGAKWTKLVVNCMFMAICGILGILDWEVTQNPQLLELCIRLGKESMQVGTTLGYRLEPIFGLSPEDFLGSTDEVLKKNLMALISHIGKESLNCILQDHMKGRRSEVEFLNGLVVRKGREAKVPTPLNEAIASLDRQVEQGTLKPDQSNLPMLEKLIARPSS